MKKIIFTIFLIFALGVTVKSNAQHQRSSIGLGILVGGSRLYGDIENSNTELTGGLLLRFNLVPFFALSASTSYGQMTGGLNAFKTEVFNNTLFGTLFLLPAKKFSPFLNLGYSSLHFVAKDGDNQQLLRPDGTPLAGWERAIQTGFGFEFFVGEQWSLSSSIDYFFSQGDELDGIKQGKNDGFFHGFFGVIHYFNKPKYTANKENIAETLESLLESSEVEDLDLKDEEPVDQELKQSIKANSSVHGFENVQELKETEDNLSPLSIQDIQEEAIEETETYNNKNEKESSAIDFTELSDEEIVSNGIYFEPGSANILDKSKHQLNQIYKYLLENPDEVIELRGFEEDSENDKNYKILSIERAKSVKTYLVNLGIKPSRIIIVTDPIE